MQISVATVSALVVFVSSALLAQPSCPEDNYYDHGIDGCSHCWVICDNAQVQRTVETCMRLCPAYAHKIGLGPDAPSEKLPNDATSDSDSPSSSSFPVGAKAAIGASVAGLVLCFLALAAVFNRQKISKLLGRRAGRRPTGEEGGGEGGGEEMSMHSLGTGCLEEGGNGQGASVFYDPETLLRGHHDQEKSDWRQGNHEMALLGYSTSTRTDFGLIEENVEPKTLVDSTLTSDPLSEAATPLVG